MLETGRSCAVSRWLVVDLALSADVTTCNSGGYNGSCAGAKEMAMGQLSDTPKVLLNPWEL